MPHVFKLAYRAPTISAMALIVMQRRGLSLAMIIAIAVVFGPNNTQAQTWPQRVVHILVPYAAGGNSDGMARTAQRLTNAFDHGFRRLPRTTAERQIWR